MAESESLLEVAERVTELLASRGIDAILIGAAAMAAHGYVRFTQDVDLAVKVHLEELRRAADDLQAAGFDVTLREPDGADPLGGVIDVSGSFGMVQIVNFGDRFPAVIEAGLAEATLLVRVGSQLRIMPLPQLIALKLYAGGRKSQADVVELLARNPDADFERIRKVCDGYRLPGFQTLLREAMGGADAEP